MHSGGTKQQAGLAAALSSRLVQIVAETTHQVPRQEDAFSDAIWHPGKTRANSQRHQPTQVRSRLLINRLARCCDTRMASTQDLCTHNSQHTQPTQVRPTTSPGAATRGWRPACAESPPCQTQKAASPGATAAGRKGLHGPAAAALELAAGVPGCCMWRRLWPAGG